MPKKPAKKSQINKRFKKSYRGLNPRWAAIGIVLFAGIGVYFTAFILAAPNNGLPKDNPARGLMYQGLKKVNKGPCKGSFVLKDEDEESKNTPCTHPDPGPANVDLRERIKTIDAELTAQSVKDRMHPPLRSDAPANADPINSNKATANVEVSENNMNSVTPRNWPCVGNGFDGYRVKLFYGYPTGAPNNLSIWRPILEGIARRMNAVVYNSAVASGDSNGMQIRFGTNNYCILTIQAIKLTGDINNFKNIKSQMINAGYIKSSWKDLIWIDGGTACGMGESYNDDSPGQLNKNNNGGLLAAVWKRCWNFGEPHEIMHMLGGVQDSSPHSTKNMHCYDEYDIMCYDDDGAGGISMKIVCPSTAAIWRYDCNFDDYFDAAPPDNDFDAAPPDNDFDAAPPIEYFAEHWNTAKNRFLIP